MKYPAFVALLAIWLVLGAPAFADLLPAGTPVQVAIEGPIDADKVKIGQTVSAHVVIPVKYQDRIVFPVGTLVKGEVTHRKNNSIAGVPGAIELGNFKITAPDGGIVPLSGTIQRQGDSRTAISLATGYFLIFPILMKGQDGIVENGAETTMFTLQEWEAR